MVRLFEPPPLTIVDRTHVVVALFAIFIHFFPTFPNPYSGFNVPLSHTAVRRWWEDVGGQPGQRQGQCYSPACAAQVSGNFISSPTCCIYHLVHCVSMGNPLWCCAVQSDREAVGAYSGGVRRGGGDVPHGFLTVYLKPSCENQRVTNSFKNLKHALCGVRD